MAVGPPINNRTKFWGNSFSDANAPPKKSNFPADQTVTVCFKTRPVVDGHKGFEATIMEGI